MCEIFVAVRKRDGRSQCGAERAAGELAGEADRRLAFIRCEGSHVDERLDVAAAGRRALLITAPPWLDRPALPAP